MKCFCVVAILAGPLFASSGCALMSDFRQNMVQTVRMFRPKSFDRLDDPMEETDGEEGETGWETIGGEARREHDLEREPDRFWREHVMSSQARDIERNLGIE